MQSSRKRAAKAWLAGTGFAVALLIAGMAAPSLSQERLEQGSGIMKACAGDVWRLCSGTTPGGERIQECIQSRMGQLSKPCLSALLDAMAGASFKVCKDQTYALCAGEKCNVFDGVAYCQCDVKHGDSVSLPFPTGNGEDVCSINAAGTDNKYMVSTYSLPEQIASPQGGGAVYTCPGDTSDGAYAQCDDADRDDSQHRRSVRRRNVLQKHRGDDVSRFRQACAEGTNYLLLPDHTGEAPHVTGRIPNPRTLPVRQVILQILQGRQSQQPYGFDNLCRRPDWHSGASDGLAQRPRSAPQRVRGRNKTRVPSTCCRGARASRRLARPANAHSSRRGKPGNSSRPLTIMKIGSRMA